MAQYYYSSNVVLEDNMNASEEDIKKIRFRTQHPPVFKFDRPCMEGEEYILSSETEPFPRRSADAQQQDNKKCRTLPTKKCCIVHFAPPKKQKCCCCSVM